MRNIIKSKSLFILFSFFCSYNNTEDYFQVHAGFSPVKVFYKIIEKNDQQILVVEHIEKNSLDLGRADQIIMRKIFSVAQEKKINVIEIPRIAVLLPEVYIPTEILLKTKITIENDTWDYKISIFPTLKINQEQIRSFAEKNEPGNRAFIENLITHSSPYGNKTNAQFSILAFSKNDNLIIGGAKILYYNRSQFELYSLYVIPTARKTGLGSILTRISKSLALAFKKSWIITYPSPWGTDQITKEALVNWYKKQGFNFSFFDKDTMYSTTNIKPDLTEKIIIEFI